MKTKISVVIPLYNKENYIIETLKSVLLQSYTNFEVVIVNDGSTDASLQKLSEIEDDRVRILNIENGGVSNARNVGINNAKFDWVALLDADDTWNQNYLQESVNIILENHDADVIATNYFLVYDSKKVKALELQDGFIDSYFKNPCINSSTVLIKKKIFKHVGDFDSKLKYGEDQHLWFRLGANCKIYFNSSPLINYRMEDHQISNSNIEKRNVSTDLVSVIDELKIYTEEWEEFKTNYLMKYLRPYYMYDAHLSSVKGIINKIPFKRRFNLLYLFYITPRFIVKPLYKVFYSLKYTK
jgi:glycosyltransferase involved in cell wall biosynthesis